MKIIYDVGSNNGDDIPYYLLKADLVVAVEADPALAAYIMQRFAAEVAAKRLVVENCVVTVDEEGGTVPFYIHRGHNVLSQFGIPPDEHRSDFDCVELPARRIIDIVEKYGSPYYIKIDVEGYDQDLLNELFRNHIYPPYLSAESHSIEVFASLVANGKYRSFKIVDGPSIPHVYGQCTIETQDGLAAYSFPDHSAGPFGNDISGRWETPATFLQTLARYGLGWKDIHVSLVDQADA